MSIEEAVWAIIGYNFFLFCWWAYWSTVDHKEIVRRLSAIEAKLPKEPVP